MLVGIRPQIRDLLRLHLMQIVKLAWDSTYIIYQMEVPIFRISKFIIVPTLNLTFDTNYESFIYVGLSIPDGGGFLYFVISISRSGSYLHTYMYSCRHLQFK